MESINYSYPIGLIGFHSGFRNNSGLLSSVERLTERESVTVQNINSSDNYQNLSEYFNSTNLLGYNDYGLTSGAGGILIQNDNKDVIKLKRAGFCGKPPTGYFIESFFDIINNSSEMIETRRKSCWGLIDEEVAVREASILENLNKIGLNSVYSVIDVFRVPIIKLELPKGFIPSQLCVQVSSDIRIDELYLSIVLDCLLPIHNKGKINLFGEDLNVNHLSSLEWNSEKIIEGVDACRIIGTALGGAYNLLHAEGYLRGYTNCWFGNEVVDSSGNISFVDLDRAFGPWETSSLTNIKQIQLFEAQIAETNILYWCPLFSSPLLLPLVSGFRDGFIIGYTDCKDPKLNSSFVNKYLNNYNKQVKMIKKG